MQLEIHQVSKSGLFNTFLSVLELLLADGQTRHLQTAFAGGVFGKPAPATTNLQDMIPRLRAHLIHHGGIFCGLRFFGAFLPCFKQGAGIGHRVVKPKAVEVVTQIIMVRDVLLGLLAVIALQPEAQLFVEPHKTHAGKAVIDLVIVLMNQIHESLKVWCAPPFLKIGITEPKVAFAYQPREQILMVNM